MIVFLDTSTLLAASWSAKGLSRLLVDYAPKAGWKLVTADYCISEVERNAHKHPAGVTGWKQIVRPRLETVGSVYVIDRPVVFDATKDRPVILSATLTNERSVSAPVFSSANNRANGLILGLAGMEATETRKSGHLPDTPISVRFRCML